MQGFAFWFVAQNHFRQGMIMGGADTFRGIGVLIGICTKRKFTQPNAKITDSFPNDPVNHRDIRIVASDGENVISLFDNDFPGCNVEETSAKFRRWEGQGNFDVMSDNQMRITMIGSMECELN